MKPLLLILFTLLQMNGLRAQIQLLNTSFEGGSTDCSDSDVKDWITCGLGVYNCIIDTIPVARPDSAVDGRFVAEVSGDSDGYLGAFTQQNECSYQKGVSYLFDVYLAAYIPTNNPSTFPKFSRGKVEIWLSNDTCSRSQLIFLSPLLDSVWDHFYVSFIPDSNYSFFTFKGHAPITSPVISTLMIDALSPISILNAHQVHSYAADTLLPIGSTACLHLNAYTDTTYSRVWWEQIGIELLDNQIDAGTVCTDTNTTYVIHMLGNDSTCAGYLPSSDTVRVRFYDPNSISPPLGGRGVLRLYPNPATDMLTIETEQTGVLSIYNSIGQMVLQTNIQNRTSNISIAEFASGVYHYKFTLAQNKTEVYGKLVKQ